MDQLTNWRSRPQIWSVSMHWYWSTDGSDSFSTRMNRPTDQRSNKPRDGCTDGLTAGRTEIRRTDGDWMDGWRFDRRTDGNSTDGRTWIQWTEGRMEIRRTDGREDPRTDRPTDGKTHGRTDPRTKGASWTNLKAGPTVMYQRDVKLFAVCSSVFGKQWTRHSNALLGGVWIFSSVFFTRCLALTFLNLLFLLVETSFLVPEWALRFFFSGCSWRTTPAHLVRAVLWTFLVHNAI